MNDMIGYIVRYKVLSTKPNSFTLNKNKRCIAQSMMFSKFTSFTLKLRSKNIQK